MNTLIGLGYILPVIAMFCMALPAGAMDIPAPEKDITSTAPSESVVLAGGCFWGVQAVFQHVKGVKSAISGYAGGDASTAHYNMVSSGNTGHAEVVKVTYDPQQVSFGHILQVYFSVVHDPTQLNRQGPDQGTQYRSAIFFATDEQRSTAQAYIKQLNNTKLFHDEIVTTLEPLTAFYPAEDYHQDFAALHPDNPYIVSHDLPKVQALKENFTDLYTERRPNEKNK